MAVHYALVPLLLLAGYVISTDLSETTNTKCVFSGKEYLPDPLFLLTAGIGLVLGRNLSRLQPADSYPDEPSTAGRLDAAKVRRWALVFALLLVPPVWLYEALGTANWSTPLGGAAAVFQPITFYVRCAIYHDKEATIVGPLIGGWTHFTILLVSFVVGHWLWADHPPKPKRETR